MWSLGPYKDEIIHPIRGVNETTLTYGDDDGTVWPVGTEAKLRSSMMGLKQIRDFTDVDISYEWNKFGYRYQEPKKKRVIAFIGCGLTIGLGLPVEESYPYIISKELGIPYVNFSEALFDEYIDILEKMSEYYEYEAIFLCEAKYVTRAQAPFKLYVNDFSFTQKKFYMQMMVESQANYMQTAELALKHLFPKAKLYHVDHPRSNKKLIHRFLDDIEFRYMEKLTYEYDTENLCVDLNRSCTGYGKQTHANLASRILKDINSSI